MSVSNLTVTDSFNMIPKGVVVAWTGTTAPDGWALCDGQNGTPDLRGRFIYGFGAGRGGSMNGRGGAETVALTEAQMPAHSHSIYSHTQGGGHCNRDNSKPCQVQLSDKDPGGGDRPFNVGTSGSGSGQPHENMPPYHVLAYIMKL